MYRTLTMIIHTFKKLFLDSMGKFFKKIGVVLALVMLACLIVLVWYQHARLLKSMHGIGDVLATVTTC